MIWGTAVCTPRCVGYCRHMLGAIPVRNIDKVVLGEWRGPRVLEVVVCGE